MIRKSMLSLIVAATSALGANEGTALDEFLPTSAGTRWHYREYDADEERWTDWDCAATIVEERVVNGRRKWKIRFEDLPATLDARLRWSLARALEAGPPGEPEEPNECWAYYDVGLEAYVYAGPKATRPVFWYPAGKKGSVFRHPREEEQKARKGRTQKPAQTTVLDLSRKVTARAGKFTCIVTETLDFDKNGKADLRTVDYWAKGVGLVLRETYNLRDGRWKYIGKLELDRFQKPAAQGRSK